jgi:hypothetical protein
VSIEICDLQGRRQLHKEFGRRARGAGELIVDTARISVRGAAWYILRVKAGDEEVANPFILLR